MRNIFKGKYDIPYGMKILIFVLLTLSLCFLVSNSQYEKEDFGTPSYRFLPKGNYHILLSYEECYGEKTIRVYSDSVTSENNYPGDIIDEIAVLDDEDNIAECDINLNDDIYGVEIRMFSGEEAVAIYYANIKSNQRFAIDRILLALFFVAFSLVIVFICKKYQPKDYTIPFVLLGICVVINVPLMNDMLLKGHDLLFHLARIEGTYQAILAGEFPVRINPIQTYGLGNATPIMYPNFFIYIPAVFRILGASTILSYKLLVVLCNILTVIFSFVSAKAIFKSERTALFVCILYSFSIYRFTDVYLRTAVGEMMAMAFLPLVLWGGYEVLWGNRKKWYILSLGLSGVIEAHILSFLMCAVFLCIEGIIWVFSKKTVRDKAERVLAVTKAAFVTILLNAGFLVPFLKFRSEDFNVFSLENPLHTSTLYLQNVFSLFPIQTGDNKGWASTRGEMPLSVGGLLILAIISISVLPLVVKKDDDKKKISEQCFALGIISLIGAMWFFPWKMLSDINGVSEIVSTLQFVWRLLSISSVMLSFSAGYGLDVWSREKEHSAMVRLLIIAFALCSFYAFDTCNSHNNMSNDELAFEGQEFFDQLYLYKGHPPVGNPYYICSEDGERLNCTNYKKSGNHVSFDIYGCDGANEDILYPLYYYPGYSVEYNGISQDVFPVNGYVASMMPVRNTHVDAYYKGFSSFAIADIVSLVTAVVFVCYWGFRRRQNEA